MNIQEMKEMIKFVDDSLIKDMNKYFSIYRRTKNKRIKRKQIKKISPIIGNMLDTILSIQIQKQFDSFTHVDLLPENNSKTFSFF